MSNEITLNGVPTRGHIKQKRRPIAMADCNDLPVGAEHWRQTSLAGPDV